MVKNVHMVLVLVYSVNVHIDGKVHGLHWLWFHIWSSFSLQLWLDVMFRHQGKGLGSGQVIVDHQYF